MRSHLSLIQAVLLLLYCVIVIEVRAEEPDYPAAALEVPIYEDGFEVFVGCGDGVPVVPEQCDDFNKSDGDGCNATCGIELGFMCTGQPSVCSTICGDGIPVGANPAMTSMYSMAMAAIPVAKSSPVLCAPASPRFAKPYVATVS